jgi:hypothetical protein
VSVGFRSLAPTLVQPLFPTSRNYVLLFDDFGFCKLQLLMSLMAAKSIDASDIAIQRIFSQYQKEAVRSGTRRITPKIFSSSGELSWSSSTVTF